MPNNTLVLALGNILRGDDGVGAAVIEALEAYDLPDHVTLLDGGTPGFETVMIMQDYQRVIVVDAADMNTEIGTWRTFTPDEVRLQSKDLHLRGTLHYAGLAEALSLGNALGLLPPEIVIVGIQPQQIDWEMGLSDDVAKVVPAVAEHIAQNLLAVPQR